MSFRKSVGDNLQFIFGFCCCQLSNVHQADLPLRQMEREDFDNTKQNSKGQKMSILDSNFF